MNIKFNYRINKITIILNIVLIITFNSIIFYYSPPQKEYIWEGLLKNPPKLQKISDYLILEIDEEVTVRLNSANSELKCGKIYEREAFYEINITKSNLKCRISQDSDWQVYPIFTDFNKGFSNSPPTRIHYQIETYFIKLLIMNIALIVLLNLIIIQKFLFKKSNINDNFRVMYIFLNTILIIMLFYAGNYTLPHIYNKFYTPISKKSVGTYDLTTIENCKQSRFIFQTRIYPHLLEKKSIFSLEKMPFILNTATKELIIQIPIDRNDKFLTIPIKYEYESNFALKLEIIDSQKIIVTNNNEVVFAKSLSLPLIKLDKLSNMTQPIESHPGIQGFISVNCQNFLQNNGMTIIWKNTIFSLLLLTLIYNSILYIRSKDFEI